ncbi:craniofacial development protein 2-like [Diadema setosum]|uniref:craniofacial development protein 2-like n=1 Tax=Diadema setosum TaxID=31175 RepID=UPI003B3AECA8
MLDTDGHRPERRSALIAHELSRLDIDIAALSEVRLADEGNLQEHGAGYTLYWSGKPRCERRLSGVGFMVKNSIASRLENLPTGHSDRIMSMRLSLRNGQYITLFSVYAPTLQAEPAEKDKFYTDLRIFSQQVREDDKVVILGDFNSRVGKDSETWSGILGKHGVGKCDDNGRLLLEFCTEQQLVITDTLFQQRDSLKTTWMHPRSKHWHLLDYILVRRRDQRDVFHTRVMPSAECHTDHRLVRCKLNLHFKPQLKCRGAHQKKFNVAYLQSAEVRCNFQTNLQTRLEDENQFKDISPEVFWARMKSAIQQSSKEVLGLSSRKNKDWFDESNQEIKKLLAKKRSAHQAHLTNPSCPVKKSAFRLACSHLQRKFERSRMSGGQTLPNKLNFVPTLAT